MPAVCADHFMPAMRILFGMPSSVGIASPGRRWLLSPTSSTWSRAPTNKSKCCIARVMPQKNATRVVPLSP
jgi:hypothetical protein